MSKMSDLEARGIKDLFSYSEGYDDGIARVIEFLETGIKENIEALEKLNGLATANILFKFIRNMALSTADETEEEEEDN